MLTRDSNRSADDEGGYRDISEIYSIRHIRDSIRIVSPQKRTLNLSSDSDAFLQTLSLFAPLGTPTLRPEGQMAIIEASSGRSLEFRARELPHIAAVMAAFCIGEDPRREVETPKAEPAPLPEVLFEEKTKAVAGIPDWIAENPDFKRNLVIDEGNIVLDFTPLRMDPKQKYTVEGRGDERSAVVWGYEVFAKGKHFGWAVLLEPNCVLVTGVGTAKHSKHRTVMSAMFRLSSHLQATEEIEENA